MTEEKEKDIITNLSNLPLDVWQELKTNAEKMMQNSKIGFFQGQALSDLAASKISEIGKKDDEPLEAAEALKEITDAISGS